MTASEALKLSQKNAKIETITDDILSAIRSYAMIGKISCIYQISSKDNALMVMPILQKMGYSTQLSQKKIRSNYWLNIVWAGSVELDKSILTE